MLQFPVINPKSHTVRGLFSDVPTSPATSITDSIATQP